MKQSKPKKMIFENYKEGIIRYIGANISLDGALKAHWHQELINYALADRYDVDFRFSENLGALRPIEKLNLQDATREPLTNHLNHTTGLPDNWESEIDDCALRFFEKLCEIVDVFYSKYGDHWET